MFRLALESGYWVFNPDKLLKEMPSRILDEWMLYYKDEPFGQMPYRIGYAAAMLGSLLGKPKGRKYFTPQDFMPEARKPRTSLAGEQFNKLLGIANLMGAKIVDPKGKLKRMIADNA